VASEPLLGLDVFMARFAEALKTGQALVAYLISLNVDEAVVMTPEVNSQ
jgi:hypothetical protein